MQEANLAKSSAKQIRPKRKKCSSIYENIVATKIAAIWPE